MKRIQPTSHTSVNIAWMCGHCFNVKYEEVPWILYQKSLSDDDFDESQIGWSPVCKNCGCKYTITRVDYDMSVALSLLNTKGYLVFQSNAGTMFERVTENDMYIRLYQEIRPNDIPSLPEGWYMDEEFKSYNEVVIRPHISDPDDLDERSKNIANFKRWLWIIPIYHGGSLPVIHIDSFDTPIGDCDLYLVLGSLYLIVDNDMLKIQKVSIYPGIFINPDEFMDPNADLTKTVYGMIREFSENDKEESTNE